VTILDDSPPVASEVRDCGDVPLSELLEVNGEDYLRVMRRIGLRDGESVTPVSAFNSSV
jgi:FXSXX-COOH protein